MRKLFNPQGMKISLMITHLHNLMKEHGDLPVYGKLYNQTSIRDIAPMWPEYVNVVHKKKRQKKEKNLKVWLPDTDVDELIDEKVLLIHT